jgi:hypothetical protein
MSSLVVLHTLLQLILTRITGRSRYYCRYLCDLLCNYYKTVQLFCSVELCDV